jgi:ribosomal protein S18 acetylase RimI-like enzyme
MGWDLCAFTMDHYDAAYALWGASEGIGLSQADERQNIARYLERNPGQSFVALEGGTMLGAVLCGNDGRRAFIHHLAVAAAARRRGVGRALVERCLAVQAGLGMRKCHIFVVAANEEGKAFWRRAGWDERTTLVVMSHDVGA